MKKFINLTVLLFLLIFIQECTGYKPIFSSNLNFQINSHTINGEKKLGTQIYSKLYKLANSDRKDGRALDIFIDIKKVKNSTVKDKTGKTLEYKITLNTKIIINDFLDNKELLNQNFILSSSYNVQDQFSETKKLEDRTLQNLLDKTVQDLIINMSENILTK